MMPNFFHDDLYVGLRALAASAFPKRCPSCGRVFETSESFLRETEVVGKKSGLKQSQDDDDKAIVEVFRNCPCGSTLLECFQDRRDTSKAGEVRRQRFGELLRYLVEQGLEVATARAELLKVVHGQHSDTLLQMRVKPPDQHKDER